MLRISLGSLGDEYMPCSSTYIHLLLTIISLQLSASLFFLYSVLKVHACGGHVAFFSGISANCSLAVIPSRKSLAVRHSRAAAPPASQPLLSAFHVRGCSLFPDNPFRSRPASSAAGGGLNGGPVFFRKPQKATVGFNSLLPLSRHRSFLPDISPGFPPFGEVVGSSGLEPPTSRLSGVRSNHLSYEPIFRGRLWFAFPAYLFVLPALRSRPSAGNRCSQPFPFVRDMPRRQPLVEMNRIELSTPCLQGRCSPS